MYVLSVCLTWLHIHLSHSKGGLYENSNAEPAMLFLVFCPIVNTVSALVAWIAVWPIKKDSKKNLNSFFNIKK